MLRSLCINKYYENENQITGSKQVINELDHKLIEELDFNLKGKDERIRNL